MQTINILMISICRFYFLSVYDSVNIILLGTRFVSGSGPVIYSSYFLFLSNRNGIENFDNNPGHPTLGIDLENENVNKI